MMMNAAMMQQRGYTQLFRDCFNLLQKYGQVESNDKFWEDACMEFSGTAQRYQNEETSALATGILLACYDELARQWELEEGKKNGLSQATPTKAQLEPVHAEAERPYHFSIS